MIASREAELVDLLCELFAADELRRVIRYMPRGGELNRSLAEGGSLIQLAGQAVEVILRNGEMESFLPHLYKQRPNLLARIAPVVQRWQSAPRLTDTEFEQWQTTLLAAFTTYDGLMRGLRTSAARQTILDLQNHRVSVIIGVIVRLAEVEGCLTQLRDAVVRALPGNNMLKYLPVPHGTAPEANPAVGGTPPRLRVGVITITPLELAAVLAHMTGYETLRPLANEVRWYSRGFVDDVEVIVAQSLKQGNLAASNVTRDLVERWSPHFIILCGIAGGIRKGIRLGDVVVAEQVFYYELAKLTPSERVARTAAWGISARLHAAAQSILACPYPPWIKQVRVPRPGGLEVDPASEIAAIGTGEKVIANADAQELTSLRAISDRISAVEMEAGGVASALHEKEMSDRLLVVRGISDHADLAKDDRYQAYAAATAAAFMFAVIERL